MKLVSYQRMAIEVLGYAYCHPKDASLRDLHARPAMLFAAVWAGRDSVKAEVIRCPAVSRGTPRSGSFERGIDSCHMARCRGDRRLSRAVYRRYSRGAAR